MFLEHIAGAKRLTPPEVFERWQVCRPCTNQMARIDVRPSWAELHDFETRILQAVEDLVRTKSAPT